MSYGLDAHGRVNQVTSPGGQVSYGYDQYGRVNAVGSTTVRWAPGGGRLEGLEDGAVWEQRCYDSGGRLTRVVAGPSGTTCDTTVGPDVTSYEYGYGASGLRETETYSGGGDATVRRFHYHADERLTGVDEETAGGATTYTLAADGTRTGELVQGPGGLVLEQRRYEHDDLGGLSAVVDELTGQAVATYTTDRSGRVQQVARPAERVTRTFGWTADDRLQEVRDRLFDETGETFTDQVRGTYAYDHGGRRIAGTGAGGTATWVWDAGGLIEERLPGQAAAVYERVGGTVASVGGLRALHDGLESIVGFAGGPRYRHDACGQYVGGAPGADVAGVGYAGQRWDADVGLSYAQQRWYEPGTGRFLSEDPVRGDPLSPMSLHAFGYANWNPLLYVDPYGEAGFFEWLTRVAFCPPAPAGSGVRQQCEDAADAVNRDPVGKLAVRAPFAPTVALAAAVCPECAVVGGTLSAGTAVALKTYEDPRKVKTLDQFTLPDWFDVADAGAGGAVAGPLLSRVSQAGHVGRVAVNALGATTGAFGVVEGGEQVVRGIETGDAGRAWLGVALLSGGAAGVTNAMPGRLNAGNYVLRYDADALYSNPLPKVQYKVKAGESAGGRGAGGTGRTVNMSTAKASSQDAAADLREYARRSNAVLQELGPQVVQSTKGPLRAAASREAAAERARAAASGSPYQGQAGHVPDTAVTGQPSPPGGYLDMRGNSNSIAGGCIGNCIGETITGYTVDGEVP